MKRLFPAWVVLGISLASPVARADYGWIPQYQQLFLRSGIDFYSTDQNYNATGALEPLTSGGNLHEYRLWLEGEYGIAQDWSTRVRLRYVNSTLDSQVPGQTLAAGSGLSDVTVALKWNLKSDYPIVTTEVFTTIPTSSTTVQAPTQLVLRDGNFDLGLILHSGTRAGPFLFSLSPGFVARLGGYSSAATGEMAVQLSFPKGFVRGFARGIYSIEDAQPFDANPLQHTALGSGGSYAKLNGSPRGFSGGAMIELVPISGFRFGGYLEHVIYGQEYPYFTSFGFDLAYSVDFFSPKKKTKVHEVPFEGEQPNGFPD